MLPLSNLVLQVTGTSAISSCSGATSALGPASVCTAQTSLATFIIFAIIIDAVIIGVWFMIGYVLNDQRIKATARGEFLQLIGTGILVAVVVGVLVFFASLYISSLGSSALNPQAMFYTCNNIAAGSRLTLFSGNFLAGTSYSTASSQNVLAANGNPSNLYEPYNLLAGTTTFPGLCAMVASPSSFTNQIDYPLATTAVLIANLTNQTAGNLNGLFELDTYLGFLDSFTPFVEECDSAGLACLIPGLGVIEFNGKVSFQPYAGYDLIFQSYAPLGDLLSLAFESYIAQFVFIIAALFIWPYLLFIGIVLRATPFTRAIGGLFIAIAIGVVIFLPVIYGLEYTNLCSGVPYNLNVGQPPPSCNGYSSTPTSAYAFNSFSYGFNGITQIPANSPITGNQYVINFFVLPNVTYIGTHNNCWPNGGIFSSELNNILAAMVPFSEITSAIFIASGNGVPSGVPVLSTQACQPTDARMLLYQLFDAYGVVGVSAYFMPIIDLMVVISGIIGLSGMLGGDTELAGLAKLV
jgi:hypothetical protein